MLDLFPATRLLGGWAFFSLVALVLNVMPSGTIATWARLAGVCLAFLVIIFVVYQLLRLNRKMISLATGLEASLRLPTGNLESIGARHFHAPYERIGTAALGLIIVCAGFGGILVITALLTSSFYALAVDSLYNPFSAWNADHNSQPANMIDMAIFFADQAAKGYFFDALEVFELNLQEKIRVVASHHPEMGVILVLYRILIPLVTVGSIVTMSKITVLRQRARYLELI